MTPRRATLLVVAAAALPRAAVVLWERRALLEEFTEKSDRFAQTLVASGTFGFLPDVPSGYTQPLYAWVLAAVYWPLERHWALVGALHVALAVVTALLVLALARRVVSPGAAVVAALVTTLHPFLVWHDAHVNREIVDQPLVAAAVLLALACLEWPTLLRAAGLGAVCGLTVLANARLVLLPVLLALYAAWRARPLGRAALVGLAVVAAAVLVVAPWVARNEARLGCLAITTDARALWKANNPDTYRVLANGGWIDDVPELPGSPPWPELAADLTLAGTPTTVDECAQVDYYRDLVTDFWREQPGEKARLAAQAVRMLWSPSFSVDQDGSGRGALADAGRRVVEPLWTTVVYVLALAGALLVPRRFLVLTLLVLGLNTAMAMVFAGTVRYRAPFDFLLAILAAAALARLYAGARGRSPARARTAP